MTTLVEELGKLPGIGRRSAERLAYHLLVTPADDVQPLLESIQALKSATHHCRTCYHVSDQNPCAICSDEDRDTTRVCVVETPRDLVKIERSGAWKGTYHVLHGSLSPLDGVEEEHLTLNGLLKRLRQGGIDEVVIATGANLAGEATALHLTDLLQDYPGQVSRIASGLPTGGQLGYASDAMLNDAVTTRRNLHSPRQRGQAMMEYVVVLLLVALTSAMLLHEFATPENPYEQREADRESWWMWPIP